MTIETLNEIKADATALRAGLLDMADKVSLVEAEGVVIPDDVDVAMDAILVNLGTVLSWVEQAITDGTGEPELTAMRLFLNELKAVFDKYSAVLERIDGSAYGTSYGGADFFRVTVTDPVSGDVETKDIVPAVADTITSVDLA
jgi:hypothetical protein